MATYAALFGALNVGGNRLKMADLCKAVSACGFSNVRSVMASGNVVFEVNEDDIDVLQKRLTACVRETFGFDSFAVVRDRDALKSEMDGNPFRAGGESKFVLTHMLVAPPPKGALENLVAANSGSERIAGKGRSVYIDFVDGVGSSKLARPLLRRHLGVEGTARSMSSIAKILAKMED